MSEKKKFPNHAGCMGDIAQLAATNPALAFALLSQKNQTPQIFRMVGTFVGGAEGEQITASTMTDENSQGFCSDFVILGAQYQIRQNDAFAGALFKGQQDYFNAKNSGINVQMYVNTCPKFDIVPDPMPIEMFASLAGDPVSEGRDTFPYGFIAPECSSIQATFTNTREFATNDQNPTEVWVSFRGLSLGCDLNTIDLSEAIEGLGKLGILDPKNILVG